MAIKASTGIVGLALFLFAACTGEAGQNGAPPVDKTYFDLAQFVKMQMAEMESHSQACRKTVRINGAIEEKSIASNEFEQELQVFVDADINKPAWSDKYSIDSLTTGGILKMVKYLATDSMMKTRELVVSFDSNNNTVSQIYVRRVVKSVIADTYNDMYLWPGKGYEIKTVQSVALSDTSRLEVKVVCE